MKKTTSGIGAVVAGLAILTLFAAAAPAAERPGFETYVVRSGDTLSKISGRVFGDVKRWREILKENPQVTNANRIFPGDTLLVPVPETAAPAGGAGGGLVAGEGAAAGIAGEGDPAPFVRGHCGSGRVGCRRGCGIRCRNRDRRRGGCWQPRRPNRRWRRRERPPSSAPRSIAPPASLRTGFPRLRSSHRRTIGSCSGRTMRPSSTNRIPPGTRFTVVRAERRIFHPVTRKDLGWLIRILGSAEVTCRGERTSTVALRAMSAAASVGDFLAADRPERRARAERAAPARRSRGAFQPEPVTA